jgi:Arc/MetJ-type ribon-helix-helix transcriptional regulator
MSIAISVRLDEESRRALAKLEATGLSRSEAIRTALILSEKQSRRREALRAEMAALEEDQEDRNEMREVAELMEALRAEG